MILPLSRNVRCNISACIIFGVAAYLFYMIIDRDPPYVWAEGDISPNPASIGGEVAVHWKIKANRFCPGWVHTQLTDHRGYIWSNKGHPVYNVTKDGDLVNTLALPRTLGPGEIIYMAVVCYQCNMLQYKWPICVRTPEIRFMVQ